MNISELLLKYRVENNLTGADLADKLGCSQASVSQWEAGASVPGAKYLHKIRDLLGLDFLPGVVVDDKIDTTQVESLDKVVLNLSDANLKLSDSNLKLTETLAQIIEVNRRIVDRLLLVDPVK